MTCSNFHFCIVFWFCFLFFAGQKTWREQKNSSEVVFPMLRTFKGAPVINIQPFVNGTQASFLTYSPPALNLLNNSTVRYLGGSLSTRVIPIIYMLVVTVGIPANVSILCLLVTKIRKVSSAILYCSLAVSDLFLLLSLFFPLHSCTKVCPRECALPG